MLEQFTVLVRKSIANHINDIISERLKTALKTETEEKNGAEEASVDTVIDSGVITTNEELEGLYIVKSILRSKIAAERITCRDAKSYFAIFIDDNNRKPICRLYLNSPNNKQIVFFDDDKKEVKHKISSIDEIYQHTEQLIGMLEKYL